MKRLLLGLLAIIFALSPSVLANREKDISSSFAIVTYHNLGSGLYALGSGPCSTPDPNPCLYFFANPANNTPTNSFVLPNIPMNLGNGAQSGANQRL
ncbi:hypothetical protein [Pedobacter sp. BAL39]|uniref:hypothetical protein n=1 Tax=Pedobacter sp. BAL39 TaxID=391596 RepID=UPI0012FCBAF8|nr:hypothetical protein [Pedobacter sp. BAL39]